MHILFCNYEYPPLGGGGGVVNAWLAEALAEQHQVTVLTSSAYGLLAEEVINNVRIIRVPVYFRKNLQSANLMSMACYVINGMRVGKKLVKSNNFDVINTHFVIPTGPVGQYLARKAGIPNVLSVHGGDLYDPSKFLSPHRHLPLRTLVKSLLRAADAVVGQSRNTNSNVAEFYDSETKCELIPLGIPRTAKQTEDREKHGIHKDKIVLVTVGRLVARKCVSQLIDIVAEIDNPDIELIVIGGGPKLEELKTQTDALGLTDQVRFPGQVSDKEKLSLLNSADIYVSTSQHEGFGLVFLEGMAAGLPVICYDHGGQTDFIQNGVHGYMVELNDKQSFREKIELLSKDKSLRQQLSENCLIGVQDYFIDRCASSYVELFNKFIAKK